MRINPERGSGPDGLQPLQQGRFILTGRTAYPASHVAAADED